MPELPEVETVRRTLRPVLRGRKIKAFTILLPKLIAASPIKPVNLKGDTIVDLGRRAKLILFNFESGRTLLVHLKMTGQLIYRPKQGRMRVGGHSIVGDIEHLPNKFTRAIFLFDDSSQLYFNDLRKFGYFKLIKTSALDKLFTDSRLGPEPLQRNFSFGSFSTALARRRASRIKDALLDQTVLAGLGNIYADEVLYSARIHPERRINTLSTDEVNSLYDSIKKILGLAVIKKGTTIRDFRDGHGVRGGMQKHLKVYGRAGHICSRCRSRIVRKKLGSRSAHFCPQCQSLTGPKRLSTLHPW